MAFLYNRVPRKIALSLILIWGSYFFYTANSQNLLLIILSAALSLLTLIFIYYEISPIFILIFLSFLSAYSLLISLYQYDIPTYLIMLATLLVFGFLFTYTERKIGILGDKRLIYLVLFSLIILEVLLALSYFMIDPISQSLIIAIVSYVCIGFCYTVIARHTDNRFSTYLIFATVAIGLIFLTSSWGGVV